MYQVEAHCSWSLIDVKYRYEAGALHFWQESFSRFYYYDYHARLFVTMAVYPHMRFLALVATVT